ncbi:hypothetical protein SmJEL517_g01535 [Synchytrium microbalum]|uniref:Peroxiredoxin-like 2A n=1 Tax=Synchytrium microbalum TaxID=1806994 RepID=A0A507CAE5_9FUNG|nr:uncharacterized protein SmJEL517_g01535 [Synchytrium microbalum]TPX36139.1 hypothetical protein SmJEL517_g01535 [Synchytrium microbalum]
MSRLVKSALHISDTFLRGIPFYQPVRKLISIDMPKNVDVNVQSIVLTKLTDGSKFSASTLWAEKPALIMVVRPALLERGMKSVAVCHQKLGAEDFMKEHWKNDDVYLDDEKAFYYLLGKGSLNTMGIIAGMASSKARANIKRAQDAGYTGNLVGEGTILGGLIIASKDGVEYEYPEMSWGDHAPIDAVLKALEKFPKV